jgi:hypothetical protein
VDRAWLGDDPPPARATRSAVGDEPPLAVDDTEDLAIVKMHGMLIGPPRLYEVVPLEITPRRLDKHLAIDELGSDRGVDHGRATAGEIRRIRQARGDRVMENGTNEHVAQDQLEIPIAIRFVISIFTP